MNKCLRGQFRVVFLYVSFTLCSGIDNQMFYPQGFGNLNFLAYGTNKCFGGEGFYNSGCTNN